MPMLEHNADTSASEMQDLPDGSEAIGVGSSEVKQSLPDHLRHLFDDGKTYAGAELTFQKTRLAFVADRGKNAAIFGIAAFVFLQMALVALTVGLVISLTPIFTAWGATAVVTIAMLLIAGIFVFAALGKTKELSGAFKSADK